MKKTIKLFFPMLIFSGLFLIGFKANAQEDPSVQQLVKNKHFIFKAQSVSPLAGGYRQLTSEYDIKLKGDTLVSFLPYFGRTYTAPMTTDEVGLKFTSTTFDYKVQPEKKGGWNIILVPKDTKDVRQLSLTVSKNGYASLQVLSNNRQPISFNGYLTAG